MVRTLGGCVAVAICSAIHRGYLNDRLSDVLNPEQITMVLSSSSLIAQLPENVRDRIGIVFGNSYNRQFQVMIAFAGLNVFVAIILAVVRRRCGVFGITLERKEGNEFMEAAGERPREKDEMVQEKPSVSESALKTTGTKLDAISTVKLENSDGIAR
jgi:hypothetical protein